MDENGFISPTMKSLAYSEFLKRHDCLGLPNGIVN